MAKRDERQIHLDPMEWRDAMKELPKKVVPKKKPAKKTKGATSSK